MTIQFLCPACSQPIEVDDEWSARPVACPFCRKTVTAPEASTLKPDVTPLVALPMSASLPPGAPTAAGPPVLVRSANPLAGWALGLAGAAVVLYVATNVILAPHILELAGPDGSMRDAQRAVSEQMQRGEAPRWMLTAAAGMCLVLALWVAGVVCGLIALRRPTGRGLAIASLAISGVMMLLFCAGLGTALAGGAIGYLPG